MKNIRIIIGKKEIYPNAERVWMEERHICMIRLKTKILGGMKPSTIEQYEEKGSE